MTDFNGMIVAHIVVTNYDLEQVRQQIAAKLSELDFVNAFSIGADE
ncbi:hypothetical protein UFOVP221_141 [uncultured Caudovirales phage]|uniref:Uncharacterized protein n=1 Tax=uncultured Caudovirales phage TaxID=2100421 RepID=A0A6J7WPF3_9CAUD|nr:hypothetical protein UFOVP221_141 [uncultured Caudovirales phage]